MDVILIEDVYKLGKIGDLVKVKTGYGRNFLLPQKLAIAASTKNKHRLEHEKKIASFRVTKAKQACQETANALTRKPISIARRVGEQDKMFGSVTAHDIERALAGAGVTIDRKKIVLQEPIKALGDYKVPVRLMSDMTAEITLSVVRE